MSSTDARFDHLSVAQRYRIARSFRDLWGQYRDSSMTVSEYQARRDGRMVAMAIKYGISKQRVWEICAHARKNHLRSRL